MLYVAEYSGEDVIVVDSETGKRQRYTSKQLSTLVQTQEVGGALTDCGTLMAVVPYQHRNAKSTLQIKTSTMKHVDVVTHRQSVTNVHVRADEIKSPVSVRLSDFGEWCADFILSGNRWCKKHKVTLVLDDSICFTDNSFGMHNFLRGEVLPNTWRDIGVLIDVSQVSDEGAASRIYRAASVDRRKIHGFDSIIDKADRKRFMVQTIEDRWRGWLGFGRR